MRVGSCFFFIKKSQYIFKKNQPDSSLSIKIIEEKQPLYPKAHCYKQAWLLCNIFSQDDVMQSFIFKFFVLFNGLLFQGTKG